MHISVLGSGSHFHLPKMVHYLEARLWNGIFESYIGILVGTIRATVLIETLPTAFNLEAILFELRTHSLGLTEDDGTTSSVLSKVQSGS